MPILSRRSFLAATAGAAMLPSAARAAPASVDVAIVGAGAAGIAAGRRLAAAGKSVVLLEAANRVGGRCITDTALFGVPCDLGAHWIHAPDSNSAARLAPSVGLDIYPAPRGQRIRIGKRNAREGEMEQFLAALVRCERAIRGAADGKADRSCAQALPQDLGDLQPLIEFYLGPFGCAKDLDQISAIDMAKSVERDIDAFCRQGFGALIAKLAVGLPIELSAPVSEIAARGREDVELVLPQGNVAARAAIVTVSTNVLAGGAIAFKPDLPKRQRDACAKLSLGSYDRIVLEMPDNPLGLQRNDLVFEKASGERTAALLANANGTALAYVDIGGSFGRELAAQGRQAMVEFATGWLADLYGAEIRKAVRRTHATQWNADSLIQGAFSAASVGGQPSRKILMEPVRERIFFAGEAVHETLWGTVAGAWESGERAADAAVKYLAAPPPAPSRRKRRRRR